MHATIHRPVTGHWQVESASCLVADLAAIIDQRVGTSTANGRTSPANAWFTIKRACEFIEAHLAEPIPIGKVSAYSATSLSRLERTFRSELQMSPSRYILTRRLAAANRKLKDANSNDTQVAQIAMDYGFNHLGRFAGAYRAHFGELPSDTLRSG